MEIQVLAVSLLSPMILAFLLGIGATLIKSDLKFPDELYTSLTIYLLLAIGLKGGYKLSITPFSEFIFPALAAISLCIMIPIWVYYIMHRIGTFGTADAAALAAHYGSVSAVTFAEAIAFHDNLKAALLRDNPEATEGFLASAGALYEGFMPGLLTIMEVPAIIIALYLARRSGSKTTLLEARQGILGIARDLFAGKSSVLLVGGLVIGYLCGKGGWDQVSPFFDVPFRGILSLFLLEAGLITGRRLGDMKRVGSFLISFGILMPIVHAVIGIGLGKLAGLSLGGSTILGVLSASASYIAAPAVIRTALPEASPTYYLTASLAITFPFNIIIGLPLYHFIAKFIFAL